MQIGEWQRGRIISSFLTYLRLGDDKVAAVLYVYVARIVTNLGRL